MMPVQQTPGSIPTSAPAGSFDPAQLADIHLPAAISHWPTAPGWWLSLLLLLVILVSVWLWKKQHDRNPDVIKARYLKRLKTEAQKELESIKRHFNESEDKQQNAHQSLELLSVFLRRYALSLLEREQVASVTDEQWLHLLDDLSGSKQFSQTFKQLLTEAPYQSPDKPVDLDLLEQLFAAAEVLLLHTRPEGGRHV